MGFSFNHILGLWPCRYIQLLQMLQRLLDLIWQLPLLIIFGSKHLFNGTYRVCQIGIVLFLVLKHFLVLDRSIFYQRFKHLSFFIEVVIVIFVWSVLPLWYPYLLQFNFFMFPQKKSLCLHLIILCTVFVCRKIIILIFRFCLLSLLIGIDGFKGLLIINKLVLNFDILSYIMLFQFYQLFCSFLLTRFLWLLPSIPGV